MGDVVDEVGDVVDEVGDVVDEVGDVVDEVGDVVDEVGDVVKDVDHDVDEIGDVAHEMEGCRGRVLGYLTQSTPTSGGWDGLLQVGEPREWGASWLWLGIASTAKLIISYRVAETRDERVADALIKDLRGRLKTIPTISTDGLESYVGPIAKWFGRAGGGVEYGHVVKNFQGKRGKDYDRYAPPTKPFVVKRPVFGTPDMDEVSTSFCERTNLTVRTCLRRFVRRGTGHSKTVRHHAAMVAIFVMWFNYCRIHETLRCTPAMQAGLSDHVWSIEELIDAALSAEPCDAPEPMPLALPPDAPKVTERKTPTGVRLRVVDGGKGHRRRRNRDGHQLDLIDVLERAKRLEEERSKAPPDEPDDPSE